MWSKYFNIELNDSLLKSVVSGGEEILIVPHSVLEDLILNSEKAKSLACSVHYSQLQTNEARHYAFLCTISDNTGRRIESIGESLDATLETAIAQNYPVLMAHKRAFDDAAIKYLGLEGKVYSDQQVEVVESKAAPSSSNEYRTPAKPASPAPVQDGFPDEDEDGDEGFAAPSAPATRSYRGRGAPASSAGAASDYQNGANSNPRRRGKVSTNQTSSSTSSNYRQYSKRGATYFASNGFANEFDDDEEDEKDEFDAMLSCSKLQQPVSIRNAYKLYPEIVIWCATEMRPYTADERRNQELCKKYLSLMEQEEN